jgi:uncharacterized protein YjbI with pentapeptide repeats
MAIVVLIRVGQHYEWTGFGETVQPKPDEQEIWPRKTLWDWLQLLIVPLALIVIGFWFTVQQDTRQQRIEDQRAAAERELAVQRAQDEALQAYLNQMGSLLLEKDLRNSEKDSEVRTLARARTVTVIQRLDSDRNGDVIRFLDEAGLIGREESSIGLLSDADVRGAYFEAYLRGARLHGVDLRYTDMPNADLRYADLSRAELGQALLFGADLRYADLSNASLLCVDLSYANLSGADLSGTYLRGADLTDADLYDADLSGADVVNEELGQAYRLTRATLPNGEEVPRSHSEKYESFLKSKGLPSPGRKIEARGKKITQKVCPQ